MTVPGAIVFAGRSWLAPCALALAALLAGIFWAARRQRAETWVLWVCGALKMLGATALACCLLEPIWVSQRARPGSNVFALIADNSQSLQIADAGDTATRGERLRSELASDPRKWQQLLEQDFQARRYTFDSRLQSVRDFGDMRFDGRASALGAALHAATERWRGQPVAGALLFTDGNATDLSGDLSAMDGCPPIYPVMTGSENELRDISVDALSVSQTAFEDAPVTVQAAVSAHDFSGSEIRARLMEGSNVVAAQTQRANAMDSRLNFRFQIQPDKPGIHFYKLEAREAGELKNVAAPTKEATLVNNSRLLSVDRGQRPLRVLCVAGRPDWEYKFLNRALEEDPQVQMATLLRIARREPKFDFRSRGGEASNPLYRGFGAATNEETARYDEPVLKRWNVKDEFELRDGFPKTAEALFKYDAIILDRVEAEFFTHEQMLLMRRFVAERGGGFLMIGGAESFREGGYDQTAIASMLPVYLDRPASVPLPAQFRLALTREGWLQPWTRLRATEADEQARLAAMPAFEVLNPMREAKPGASILETVSDAGNHTYPALVTQKFGRGAVAALMVGDLWRWGISDEEMQRDLGKTWRQLVRWLVSDVPGRVSVEARSTEDPTLVRIVVEARDAEFRPLENASARVTVRPVAGATQTKPLDLTAEPSATAPGAYEVSYVAREAGAYLIDSTVTQADGQVAGHHAAGWTADPAAEEFRALKPNRGLLEQIARRTGGQMVAMADLPKFVAKLPERGAPITESVAEPLWRLPSVFAFALVCFVMDWGLRRWRGLA